MHPLVVPFLKRFLFLAAVSAVLVLGVSELAYRLQREDTSRAPKTVELIIPAGTAEQVAAGETAPSIPEEMIFVLGDTLLVRNEDSVDHQLGPLWIPVGKTASLLLDQASDYAYSCSFQPSQYMGLTVREAVTWKSRLAALWYGGPPTLMFLLVYSFVVRPLDSQPKAKASAT
jgi:hypothetical protein